MQWADLPEDTPVEHGMITKSIQQAQIRVEGHNFDIRKRVLEYDDVVNKQRESTYAQRRKILTAEPAELREQIQHMITEQIEALVAEHTQGDPVDWDLDELHRAALAIYPVPSDITPETLAGYQDPDDITLALVKGALQAYDDRLELFGEEWMAQAEREVLLNAVDVLWQRHLTDLDVLREGIGLVGYGGRDPLVEYKRESFHMWTGLQDEIKAKVVQDIYRVVPRERALPTLRLSNIRTGRGVMPSAPAAAPEPVRNIGMYDNVGRNDPCPCGSGKKFKHCHYREMQQQRQTVAPEVVRHQASRRRR